MRLRLGLLQDPAVIERQVAKELAEAEAKRKKAQIPTVKTEAQTIRDDAARAKEKEDLTEKAKAARKPRIRPLSEAKAIESGATFISESFLFLVAGGIIVFESWRSKRKENTRREDVSERLQSLESKIEGLRTELREERMKTSTTESETQAQDDKKPETKPSPQEKRK
jgi:optic atrophy 3 protein